ncbi:hypothetical protein HK096_006446 [Nowakowskiella sp. JEL0078]|nr:hypothetical protein HK096_006446 [Nowakowskiella sp. JEL0078]
MDKKKSSNSSVFFRKKPILVNVANLTLKGHLGLEAASVHGVLIISNDSNNNHKKVVDGISVRLLGSLNCSVSLHDRSFEEIVHTILDITQPIFERGTKRVPTSVTLDSLPNQLNSSAVNLNSGHTTVFIQSEEGIDIPSKKQIFIPITIDIPQIKGEKLPPSIALWRKTHCCETKYRLQVLIKQEGMKEPIELEVALPVQVETFNPGDVAVYVRGKDAVLFTLKFPRILIPSEHWDFSYTFKYTDQNPNSNWRVKGISIELSEMVTLDPAFSQYKQGDVLNLTRTVFTWKSTEGAQNWENLNVVTFEAPRWPTTVEDFPGVNPSGHWDVLTISHVFTIDLSFLGVNPIRYEFPVNVLAASLNSLKDLTKNHSKLLLDIWEFKDGSDEVIASVKLRSPIPRESNNSPEFDYLNEAIRNSLDISRTSSGRTGLVNGLTTFDFNSRRNSLTISRNLGNLLDFEEDKIGAEGNTVPPSYTDVVSSKHRVAVAYYPIQVDEILLEYNDLVEVL